MTDAIILWLREAERRGKIEDHTDSGHEHFCTYCHVDRGLYTCWRDNCNDPLKPCAGHEEAIEEAVERRVQRGYFLAMKGERSNETNSMARTDC